MGRLSNGNGRHARITTDVILEKVLGLATVNWGTTLVTDGDHREAYIQALRAADNNDYQKLLEFVSN